jgi:hypothetical protein
MISPSLIEVKFVPIIDLNLRRPDRLLKFGLLEFEKLGRIRVVPEGVERV